MILNKGSEMLNMAIWRQLLVHFVIVFCSVLNNIIHEIDLLVILNKGTQMQNTAIWRPLLVHCVIDYCSVMNNTR